MLEGQANHLRVSHGGASRFPLVDGDAIDAEVVSQVLLGESVADAPFAEAISVERGLFS